MSVDKNTGNMQLFENQEFGNIRTLETDDGRVLFCGADVAAALGYAKPRNAIATHCKGALKQGILTNGGKQEMTFIPESDVYRLTFGSKLPNAERFTDWVAEEVIPSIRRHGAYMTEETLEKALLCPDFLIRLATELKEEKDRNIKLETAVSVQRQQIAELKPRADYTDIILKNKDLVTISQIAKDYGMSAQQMNQKLHELQVQFKQSGQWMLYSRYHGKGYTHSETFLSYKSDGSSKVIMITKWTQKGRLFIYARLKSAGILPVIERGSQYERVSQD